MGDIESGSLEGLDLSDDAAGDGEDLLGLLGDFSGDLLADEFSYEVFKGGLADFLDDDVGHLLSDLFDLGSLGVGGGSVLVALSLGEGEGEESEEESVGGLSVNGGLDKSVPFLNQRAEAVSGGVHSVEVGQCESALGLGGVVDDQLDLLVGEGGGHVQVGQVDFEHSSLQSVGR